MLPFVGSREGARLVGDPPLSFTVEGSRDQDVALPLLALMKWSCLWMGQTAHRLVPSHSLVQGQHIKRCSEQIWTAGETRGAGGPWAWRKDCLQKGGRARPGRAEVGALMEPSSEAPPHCVPLLIVTSPTGSGERKRRSLAGTTGWEVQGPSLSSLY